MKKLVLLLLLLFIGYFPQRAYAMEDPRTIPNNKVGIHILFPSELSNAASLINTSGGDWGYVTIPIQAGDKDLKKWQDFMDQARQLHVIPIIRLATEGDYFNTKVWRKPDYSDILDFANFLNSLNWPTENRYIIVFNEVNNGDEWGGQPDPSGYAQLLSYAVTVFKQRNPNFFIISAGLDNAASNTNDTYNEYTFLDQMQQAVPGIFNQIDGLGSHSYPNPAFSMPPSIQNQESITSFMYERNVIHQWTTKDLPTFITETGWSNELLSDQTIASYFTQAFQTVWNDPNVVAVTPFLLDAGSGPFQQFSFINSDGSPRDVYKAIVALPKVKGQPTLTQTVLSDSIQISDNSLPVETFHAVAVKESLPAFIDKGLKNIGKWILNLE